jgi:hypothetical protein
MDMCVLKQRMFFIIQWSYVQQVIIVLQVYKLLVLQEHSNLEYLQLPSPRVHHVLLDITAD